MANVGLVSSHDQCCEKSPERPSVMIELQRRREKAVTELSRIDEAISLFSRQPDLEQALSLLGTIGMNRY